MAEILKTPTQKQLKDAARKIVQNANAAEIQQEQVIREALSTLTGSNAAFEGSEELAALLNLPDEHFALLSGDFYNEIEKEFNNTNNQLAIVRAMNISGLKLEDLEDEFKQLCEEMDTKLVSILSIQKINFLKKLFSLTYNAAFLAEGIAKRKMLVPIEICREGAQIPNYAHLSDAGMDVYVVEDITINPGETKLVPLGIKCAIPLGYELQVRPRSGRSLNSKLRVANAPGTIDPDYRGEICVIVDNIDQTIRNAKIDESGRLYDIEWGSAITLTKGEKVAQLVLSEAPKAIFYEVDNVEKFGDNRNGGFGSTGV